MEADRMIAAYETCSFGQKSFSKGVSNRLTDGMYAAQLKAYLAHVARKHLLVLPFQAMLDDTPDHLKR